MLGLGAMLNQCQALLLHYCRVCWLVSKTIYPRISRAPQWQRKQTINKQFWVGLRACQPRYLFFIFFELQLNQIMKLNTPRKTKIKNWWKEPKKLIIACFVSLTMAVWRRIITITINNSVNTHFLVYSVSKSKENRP